MILYIHTFELAFGKHPLPEKFFHRIILMQNELTYSKITVGRKLHFVFELIIKILLNIMEVLRKII